MGAKQEKERLRKEESKKATTKMGKMEEAREIQPQKHCQRIKREAFNNIFS